MTRYAAGPDAVNGSIGSAAGLARAGRRARAAAEAGARPVRRWAQDRPSARWAARWRLRQPAQRTDRPRARWAAWRASGDGPRMAGPRGERPPHGRARAPAKVLGAASGGDAARPSGSPIGSVSGRPAAVHPLRRCTAPARPYGVAGPGSRNRSWAEKH